MRNLLIAAAAFIAIAAPGVAAAQTGYVGLNYTTGSTDFGSGDNEDFTGVAGEGVVAFDAGKLGIQLDAGVGNIDPDHADNTDFWNVGGHVYSRGDKWLVGGFATYSNIDNGGSNGSSDAWTAGGEVQRYLGRTTLGAALTYAKVDDIDADGWFIDGEVKHFYTDNFSVNAGLTAGQISVHNEDANDLGVGVGAEYQFAALPVSLYAQYAHSSIDPDHFDNIDSDALTVGVRWNFGGTLFERDRSGAGLANRSLSSSLLSSAAGL